MTDTPGLYRNEAGETLSKTCPCSEQFFRPRGISANRWAVKKYCGQACNRKYGGGTRPRESHCRGKDKATGRRYLHPMSGDNLYIDSSGKRRCRACATIADTERSAPQRQRVPPNPVPSRDRKSRQPVPPPASVGPSKPWRPPGWAPQPYFWTEESAS